VQAAQSAFSSQLALAQSGNLDAQNTITQFAEDLRKAGQDFFGSSSGFQNILDEIKTGLLGLPVVSASTDPVANALLNVIAPGIAGTTAAVAATTTAVDTASVQAELDATIQTGVLNIINASTQAANVQTAIANNLLASANTLTLTTQSIQNTANSFLDSMNTLLDQIRTNTAILLSIENLSSQSNNTLSSINARANEISGHTGHMYAPGGSLQFFLAQGGFVGGSGALPMMRASGGGTDTVSAMLTPGEFVVRKSVAQANIGLLTRLNAGGSALDENALGRIEAILYRIAALQERGNVAIDRNTIATVGQTELINRETRLQSRKAS